MVIDRPFYQFSTLLTCFLVLILAISSIAFFMAAARCVIDGAGGLSLLIQGQVLKTRSVGTRLSGPAVSLVAFTAIYKANSLVILKSCSSFMIIWYAQRKVR